MIVGLVVPATAAAATMSFATAKRAITNHAYQLTVEDNADHFSVSGCFRVNKKRIACHVEIYGLPSNGFLVDCGFYSHAFYVGNSRRVHLGDTKPKCRIE